MSPRAKITVLTFFFSLCGTAAVITAYLQAAADENVKPSVLIAVVERQLGELRGGNFPRAYEDASRTIQQRFSEAQFANMVQAQYPAMMRVSRAQYWLRAIPRAHATMEV